MDIYEKTKRFYERVNGEKRIIGKSFLGREIYAIRLGEGRPTGVAQYAIHGREWITAELAFKQYRRGLKSGSVWLIPLMNPDGALISYTGKDPLWKANGRRVDLNVNFDADWGTGEKNVRTPASENYIGETPFSETETRVLRDFTLEIQPDFTISYHTKGEEIYWYYYQDEPTLRRDKEIAKALSASTGYPLKFAYGSAGGYKDWCIQKLKIPAFTVEVGKDGLKHPLGYGALRDIMRKNGNALETLIEAVKRSKA